MPVRLDRNSADFDARFAAFLAAKREVSADVERATRAIVDDVAARGDAALIEATKKFDRLELAASGLRVTSADEIDAAVKACDAKTLDALKFAAARIEAFHRLQLPKDERFTDALGVELGWRWSAIDAVGLYVPGGTAAYPSSVLDECGAGPRRRRAARVVMVVPSPDGKLNPLVLAAAHLGGVSEIYRVGGAQAVAASGLRHRDHCAGRQNRRSRQRLCRRRQAAGVRQGRHRHDRRSRPKCWSLQTTPAMPAGSRRICWRRPSMTPARSRS